MTPPSGRQFELRAGAQRAVVVEVGGGVRHYSVDGFEALEGYAEDAPCTGARGTPLIPWPNRLRDGRYEWQGREHQVPLTEPRLRNAIHGLCRWQSWECRHHERDRVVMGIRLHPQPGYEFDLDAEVEYRLDRAGLEVTVRGRNQGTAALPFGAGQHPYIRVSDGTIDGARLRSPARTRQLIDRRQIPTGETRPVRGRFDFRRPRPIGDTVLDVPLQDLERDADGLARTVLEGPARRVTLWQDEAFGYLMLFTGDTLAPSERRRGLGVEPMTCAPNAFQNHLGLRRLEPGDALEARWGITVEA